MNMWARVESGVVVEVTEIDPADRFHPDLMWLASPKGVQPGYSYVDGKFKAPSKEDFLRVRFSPREYIKRFTFEEQVAVRQAQLVDMEVGLVYDDFNRAEFINIEDPSVSAGIDLYVAKGLLSPERRDELLQPAGPDEIAS
ncbi:hypothetical protein [Achromobacter animicus]|uniref:hypothetical protein n=1 Tax=Achromobacter animicus TaxID=1389935 RepID=UPI0028AEBC7C|nr:hypothetical protein [Achromobacter animicus]